MRPCLRAFSSPAIVRSLIRMRSCLAIRGQNAQHGVFEDPAAVEILLRQASEAYAGGLKASEVVQLRIPDDGDRHS